jgi:hypothetical protein
MSKDFVITAHNHAEFEALRSENAPTANMNGGAAVTIAEWLTGQPQDEHGTLDPVDALGCWPEIENVAREADEAEGRIVLGGDGIGIWQARVANVREVLEAAMRVGRTVTWV